MSSVFTFIIFLYFLPPINGISYPISKFSCGNITMDMNYPFYSNYTSPNCGLYFVQCLNQIPMIRFSSQEFLYPVVNISYTDRILLIHDLKLSISPYPWGSNCVFLYDFTAAPISNVNVTQLSLMIINNQFLFDCHHDSDGNIFDDMYKTSLCKDYDLYYTRELNSRPSSNCSSSGSFWFHWKLSFNRDNGSLSLLSAGFSKSWYLQPDCFSCQITGENCSPGGARSSSCECNSKECNESGRYKSSSTSIAVIVNLIIGAILLGIGAILSGLVLYYFLWRLTRQRHA